MFWFIVGVILIYIGINGNLGAILAALIVPDALAERSY